MKLSKKQRNQLLEWIGEGLESGEINKHASKFKPPFQVTRQQVDFYRKSRDLELQKIKGEQETSALRTGLALREKRVALLQELAEKLREDLFEKDLLWVDQAKGLGSGPTWERYEYKEFNAAEVAQLRGVLDDLAAEVTDRVKRTELTGKDGNPLLGKILNDIDFDLLPSTVLEKIRTCKDVPEVLDVILKYVITNRTADDKQ